MTNNTSQDTVSLKIIVDGKDLFQKYFYISIHTLKGVNKIPVARITLHDGAPSLGSFLATDSKDFSIGASFEVKAGYHDDVATIFKGEITKLSISAYGADHSVLVVECRDAAYHTTLRRKNAHFESTTDSDCISKILDHYSGISKSIDSTTVCHETLVQQSITDWDFINLRAEANGLVVMCSDGNFKVKKISTNSSPSKEFVYGENIVEMEMGMDCRSQIASCEGKSWNPDELKVLDVVSSDIADQSFGNISYSDLAKATKDQKASLYHDGLLADSEMKNVATAMVEFSRLAKIQGKITVEGAHDLKFDTMIKITKGALNFQGNAYVSGINHIIAGGSWKTELILGMDNVRYMNKYSDVCALPAAGLLAPSSGIQIGRVKQVFGDPKGMSRVFVNMPMIHKAEEGIWCRVSSFYATDEVGILFFPEIDSEVLVSFVNNDPRSPIILGSMYGKKHKVPVPLDEKNSKKTITVKNKLKISFDEIDKVILIDIEGSEKRSIAISDKDSSIALTNGSSGKIILGKNGIEISSTGDIKFSADGAIKLNAKTNIDIESVGQAQMKGQIAKVVGETTASLEGSIMAEVKSSGETIVKGAMVMIN